MQEDIHEQAEVTITETKLILSGPSCRALCYHPNRKQGQKRQEKREN